MLFNILWGIACGVILCFAQIAHDKAERFYNAASNNLKEARIINDKTRALLGLPPEEPSAK